MAPGVGRQSQTDVRERFQAGQGGRSFDSALLPHFLPCLRLLLRTWASLPDGLLTPAKCPQVLAISASTVAFIFLHQRPPGVTARCAHTKHLMALRFFPALTSGREQRWHFGGSSATSGSGSGYSLKHDGQTILTTARPLALLLPCGRRRARRLG